MRTRLGRRPGGPWQRQPLSQRQGNSFHQAGTVGLIFLIAHLRLSEPERVAIAYLAALISESTGRHGRALYLPAWLICILAHGRSADQQIRAHAATSGAAGP
jgi:hypothetical protein